MSGRGDDKCINQIVATRPCRVDGVAAPDSLVDYAQVTTGEALHPLTVERLAPQLLGNDASAPLPLPDYTAYVRGVFEKLEPV